VDRAALHLPRAAPPRHAYGAAAAPRQATDDLLAGALVPPRASLIEREPTRLP
jgi:hypothetical protein